MIRSLLADSLAVWKLRGSVTEDDKGVLIRIDGGPTVRVASGHRIRWIVQSEGDSPRDCSSIVGVLSAVREALAVSGGPALRISPAPSEP